MILSEIPKLVINLPERADRLELLKKELSGWDYEIVPGVKHDLFSFKGIAQAHINCVLIAKMREWHTVLIMEDDLVLRRGAVEYFNNALQHAPDNWDILLGGLYNSKGLTTHNEYWDKTKEFCGAHFYIASERVFERILSWNGRQHIDRWINLGGNQLNCYVVKKFIATQRNGFSDNVKKNVDYSDKIKKFQLL